MTDQFYPPIGDRSERAGFNWRKYWKKGTIRLSYRFIELAIVAVALYLYHITRITTPAL